MRRILVILVCILILTGCSTQDAQMDRAMSLRQKMQEGNGCAFDAVITADYGEITYTFKMNCSIDPQGNMRFCVLEPESISGITGIVTAQGGKLTFDDKALAFSVLADDQITPVTAPWVFIHALRSGYLRSCGEEGAGLHIIVDDSYQADSLQLDVMTDKNDIPVFGEILWKGKRVLSLEIVNFTFM